MRILLAGASGLIGKQLINLLKGEHELVQLTRSAATSAAALRPAEWNPALGLIHPQALDGIDAVISLSGAPLTRLPWTAKYRHQIKASRVNSTRTLAEAIAAAPHPPHTWISGSAVGIYGDRPGQMLTETSSAGQGCLAEVVAAWEAAAQPAESHTRIVYARTGIVVANGGAFAPLLLLTKLGLGGKLGSGRQHWPWISLMDEVRAISYLLANREIAGPVNLVGPASADVETITRTLARELKRPYFAHVPAGILKLVLGVAARDLLLSDQAAVPQVLNEAGFTFKHRHITQALTELVSKVSSDE